MAPYPNYVSSEERKAISSSISYKVYQPNENPTQWQNDFYNITEPIVKEQKPTDAMLAGRQQKSFEVGDRVVVKRMPIKKIKELQKNHGEWNPRMEEWMGKQVLILKFLPEGDLLVEISPMVQWIMNRECVELLDEDMTIFEVGDKAKLKKLSTEKMKEIQHRTASWVPILEEMKGRLCEVISTIEEYTVAIKLSNGFVFCVNQGLLEKVAVSLDKHVKQKEEPVFLKGDNVQVKDMGRELIAKHYKDYGLKLDPNVLKEKPGEGEVIYVTFGRIIHVRLSSGNIVTCCPPILKLMKHTTLPMEKTTHDFGVDLIIQQLNPFVEIKAYKSGFSSIEDIMNHMQSLLDIDMSQGQKEVIQNMWQITEEVLLEDFLEKQEMDETDEKVQSQQFVPGDRVSVKIMSVVDFAFKLRSSSDSLITNMPNMIMAIGKQGFVTNISPDTRDIHVLIDGLEHPLVLNSDCIDMVEKAETNFFEVGQRYMFKSLPTEKMKKLQENHGGWIPFMEDIKGKECIVRVHLPLQVETMDEYTLRINPQLIESSVPQQPQGKPEKCFQVGDFVRVKDMKKDRVKKLFAHYGVPPNWANEIFRMKKQIGRVFNVTKGRIIHIQFISGKTTDGAVGESKLLISCRPVLELVEDDQIPDIVKEFRALEEQIGEVKHCSQQRVSFQLSAAGSKFTVAGCPSPKDLLRATATGDIEATRFILRQHPQWVDVISENGEETAIMNACASGNIEIVRALVEAGARVDLENIDCNTATIIAAWKGKKDILQYLLDKGSKFNKQNSDGFNAIHAAILGESEECLGLLLERCEPCDFKTKSHQGVTPRLLAITMNNESILKRILASDVFKAAEKDDDGAIPLHEAALWDNVLVAKACLERNLKGRNEKKQDLWTPLHLAAFNSNIDVLRLLIEQGCSMNETNEDDETPLFLAVSNCDQQVVEILLDANADPNIPNEDRETCLHHIFKRQEKSIDQQQILESSLLPEPIVIFTPTKSQWLNLAKVLISNGAKADVKDNDGKTPLDLIKDETFKAEILLQIDALNSVDNNLKDFEQKIRDLSPEERLHRVYQSNNFAVRYFGIDGGILEVDSANVRMYVPPGAIKGQEQLIYIYLDPVNTIEGKIAPVVEVGPPGTTFDKKITLSYPHCATTESEWNFSTMISKQTDSKYKEWKDVIKEEGVESSVKKGRVVIKTSHFTRFTTTGEPKTKDAPVQKNMRIGAFGKDHKQGQNTYQFRVRTWEDTTYATQVVRDKEINYLKTKPIDDDRPLLVRQNNEDVSVKVNNVKKGWKKRQHGNEYRLKFSDVWEDNRPSCTVDLDKTKENAKDHQVYCQVRASQMKSPKKEHVDLSISPVIMTEEEDKDEFRHRDTGKSLKVILLGSFPADLPGLSEQQYLGLCGLLNVKSVDGKDWRCIADELRDEDLKGMQLVDNIEASCAARHNDSPANFVLRRYLYGCRAESDDPLDDLKDLFERKKLDQCLRLVEEYILKKIALKMDRLSM